MNGYLSDHISKELTLSTVEGYVDFAWDSFQMDFHTHAGIEINYVSDGSCAYYVNSERYVLKKHNLLLFNSGLWHKLEFIPNTPCSLHGCSLAPAAANEGMLPLRSLIQSNSDLKQFVHSFSGVAIISDAHSIYPSIKAVLDEFQHKHCPCYSNIIINKMLIDIARVYQSANSYLISHINAIKDYIQQNYCNITCIDDIANHVGLNKTYMQRIFKQQMECTVWQYLTNVRMRTAELLLKSSDINIGDLDQQVGINSRQNFYLLFRKQYGVSPQEFRKQYRELAAKDDSGEETYHIQSAENGFAKKRKNRKEGEQHV